MLSINLFSNSQEQGYGMAVAKSSSVLEAQYGGILSSCAYYKHNPIFLTGGLLDSFKFGNIGKAFFKIFIGRYIIIHLTTVVGHVGGKVEIACSG